MFSWTVEPVFQKRKAYFAGHRPGIKKTFRFLFIPLFSYTIWEESK